MWDYLVSHTQCNLIQNMNHARGIGLIGDTCKVKWRLFVSSYFTIWWRRNYMCMLGSVFAWCYAQKWTSLVSIILQSGLETWKREQMLDQSAVLRYRSINYVYRNYHISFISIICHFADETNHEIGENLMKQFTIIVVKKKRTYKNKYFYMYLFLHLHIHIIRSTLHTPSAKFLYFLHSGE